MRMPVFLIGLWQGLCRKVQLIWKEDNSPKKQHPNGGEEAMLLVPISPGRSKLLFFLFFCGLTAVVCKAFWLQCGIDTEFLQKQGEARYARTLSVPAQRGQIVDRNGVVLASTIPARSIWAVPEEAAEASRTQIGKLAELVGEDEKAVWQRIHERRNRSFVYIKRQLDCAGGTGSADSGDLHQ